MCVTCPLTSSHYGKRPSLRGPGWEEGEAKGLRPERPSANGRAQTRPATTKDRRPKARSEREPGASAGPQGAVPAQLEQGRRRRHAASLRSPASARRDTESTCGGEFGPVEYTGNEPEFEGATWVDADQREAYPIERLREIGDELGDHVRRLGRLEIWLQFEDLDAAAEE